MNEELMTNYNIQFDKTPIGGIVELPISLLNPIIIDDYTASHASGPIEVYRSSKSGEINIDDGNHRYFDRKRKILIENNYQKPNFDAEMMAVRKVIPEIEW